MNAGLKLTQDVIKDLIEIDVNFYRENHADLTRHSEEELIQHYAENGYAEGRMCHKMSVRETFIEVKDDSKTLEIGPFVNPVMRGRNVKYADVLDAKELKKRAEKIGIDFDFIPEIHFVSHDGSLNFIEETFDLVFSSHNLEHHPDLITHLNEVSAILNKGGVYKIIVPNCAYCFDAKLAPSKISEIILAHHQKLKVHSLAKVIEHRALTTHNESVKHWEDLRAGRAEYARIDVNKVGAALREYELANGSYIDVHSWQFMPHTLSDILQSLINLNLIGYESLRCFGPVCGRNEFCLEILK